MRRLRECMDDCRQLRIKGRRGVVGKESWSIYADRYVIDSRMVVGGRAFTIVPDYMIDRRIE